MTIRSYRITSVQGVELGIHDGEGPIGALDALSYDVDGKSHAQSCADRGVSPDNWTTDRFRFARGLFGLLVAELPS